MADNHQVSSHNEEKHHVIEIPANHGASEITFTIRYSTQPKPIEKKEEHEEPEEEGIENAVAEVNQSVPILDNSLHEQSVILMSTTISTVMLMSGKMDIPASYLLWTQRFIKHCYDRNGKHPKNIEKILNILRVEDEPEEEPVCTCPPFFHKKKSELQ